MKTIFITGCGSGLGNAAAFALAKRGHFVYATTHSDEQAKKINELSKDLKLTLQSFKLDILSPEDRLLIKDLHIDVLINNAAIGDSGSVCEIPIDKFRETFETNVFATLELTQLALKRMIRKKSGRIIFISSLAGLSPVPFLSPYSSTKFALECIASCLNNELKELKKVSIPIVLIEPGAYATGFNQKNISKQFVWMDKSSYFKKKLRQLKFKQFSYFKLVESSNFDSIIKKYISAVEDVKPKDRYSAPRLQEKYIKLKNTLLK
ncbi:SDR family NAD(P)-dependent oxidoreductase [Oceanirhabdus sp. W0125-5]|uniref:SDR family NAD(P)-dependent oxidoreductase n=1 Tax=Oceanirhabdus sp. W0125-5 TaxID=2999116 RepID=UPI0022F2F14D|nr:SDR family NAD(P)-dependent oxidoreductase [Oceanirhabdus sp. W0125-5]WBW95033.1 SDR family NAD(P)-dependent oxidoreductase [Oceanirhabdus sp. W0125-5]